MSTSNGRFTRADEDAFGVGMAIDGVGLYDGFFYLVGGDGVTGADVRIDLVGDEVAVFFTFWCGNFVCLEWQLNRPRFALLLRFFGGDTVCGGSGMDSWVITCKQSSSSV